MAQPAQSALRRLRELLLPRGVAVDGAMQRIDQYRHSLVERFLTDDLLPLLAAHLDGRPKANALATATLRHLHAFLSQHYASAQAQTGPPAKSPGRATDTQPRLEWPGQGRHYVTTGRHVTDCRYTVGSVTVRLMLHEDSRTPDERGHQRSYLLPQYERVNFDADTATVLIPFESRPLRADEAGRYGPRNVQRALLTEAEQRLPKVFPPKNPAREALEAMATSKRSWLALHLARYARQRSADRLVHTDLAAYLRHGLESYLRDHVVPLDAILDSDEHPGLPELDVAQALRDVAHALIDRLAHGEDCQRLLFEKPKFVCRTSYLVTVAHVPDDLLDSVADNDAQWTEWRELLGPAGPDAAWARDERLSWLEAHPTLVVDTRHFDTGFTDRLLAAFPDLDEATDGLLVQSENWQALRLLAPRHSESVKCIYIDPPYNTGQSAGAYQDRFASSTWLTMMAERVEAGWDFLCPEGLLFVSIDSRERSRLAVLMGQLLPPGAALPEIAVKVKDAAGVGQQSLVFDVMEYLLVYARDLSVLRRQGAAPAQELRELTGPPKGYRLWVQDYGTPELVEEVERPSVGTVRIHACASPAISSPGDLHWPDEHVAQAEHVYADYNPSGGMIKEILHRIPKRGLSFIEYVPSLGRSAGRLTRVYFWNRRILARLSDVLVIHNGRPHRRSALTNLWEVTNATLHKEGGVTFRQGKKPLALLEKIVGHFTGDGHTVLDFFAGSGTTGQAVINRSRLDGQRRRFILVEMESYFHSVLVPRIKKAILTSEWRGRRPQLSLTAEQVDAGPRLVKVLEIESFEAAVAGARFPDEPRGPEAETVRYDVPCVGDEPTLRLRGAPWQRPFSWRLRGSDGAGFDVDLPETFALLMGLRVRSRRVLSDRGRRYLVQRGAAGQDEVAVIWRDTCGWSDEDFGEDRDFVAEEGLAAGADKVYVNHRSLIPGAIVLDAVFERIMFPPPR